MQKQNICLQEQSFQLHYYEAEHPPASRFCSFGYEVLPLAP
jgi:hypothetical protein